MHNWLHDISIGIALNVNFDFVYSEILNFLAGLTLKPLVIKARANARKESAKIRNRKIQKKVPQIQFKCSYIFSLSLINYIISVMHFFLQFNGTATHPRLSVFCSDKQLYAMLVDDQNKKCLFYGSTLQKLFRENPPCSTAVSNPHHFWDILYETVKTKQLSLHYTLAIVFFLKDSVKHCLRKLLNVLGRLLSKPVLIST